MAVDTVPSLLHVSFTTINYNIGFSIERVGSVKLVQGDWQETSNTAFERYSLCDSHLKLISRTLLVTLPGLYKVVWHNSYSYLKAKTIKYRIRVLTKHSGKETISSLEDLLTQGSLSDIELLSFHRMRDAYPDYIPIVRIARPADKSVQVKKRCLVMRASMGKVQIEIDDKIQEVELDIEKIKSAHFEADKFYH